MEPEQRGRTSRASSTSSLGREVRCGCQYYQSDSLLPERRALLSRPSSRTMKEPPAVRCSEHEYEPIAPPSPVPAPVPAVAPIVRITDTDLVPVADSDESLDDRAIPPELILDGGIILPLDGKIEDSVMEGQELAEAGDTSEEQQLEETAQQLQDRLEERFLSSATPGTESRTDCEVNTSQVDSSALEELPLRRGARGLPQRLRTQAGKLRSRLRGLQRPTFSFPTRQKPEKTRSTSSGKSDKSKRSSEKRPSRMDRIRSSFSERPRFSLPERPKFNLPERPKFHLPERPKFNLPERPKFNIKKPNIKLPSTLTRTRKPPPLRDQQQQRSTDSTVGWKRNIFDFSTYPRIFDKKSKRRGDYATSSPKDSRAQSAESATFPRARKGLTARWAQRFGEARRGDDNWHRPSLEDTKVSVRIEEETITIKQTKIPWKESQKHGQEDDSEEIQYIDYDQESPEISDRQTHPSQTEEESYEREPIDLDPRLYGDQAVRNIYSRAPKETTTDERQEDWRAKEELIIVREEFRPIQRSRSLTEQVSHTDERYNESFPPVDPRLFEARKMPSEEEDEEEIEADISSAPSDREQQHSSGSSCDRRRRGVIEEIDSDEFFLRESGISQDDMNLGKYLSSEIKEAFRSDMNNALANEEMLPIPPQRPERTRSLRKRKEGSVESYNAMPPVRPKRERAGIRRSEESVDYLFRERARSDSRHRVVYHTEGSPREETPAEPLDDIVVVKPMRRKSKSSLRSQSQPPIDGSIPLRSIPSTELPRPPSPIVPSSPPIAPTRRKRPRREMAMSQRNGDIAPLYNGHPQWAEIEDGPKGSLSPVEMDKIEMPAIGMTRSEEDLRIAMRLQGEDYMEPVPVPPKRRSRSRGTSVAQDDDRTSHGAESLPEIGYVEEDIPRDDGESGRDLSGYAIVDKREKPPRPPPPRRRRDKFATTPRPTPPKRPQRAYSTLGPAKSKESRKVLSGSVDALEESGATPYIEIDSDGEHKDLRSGEILSKMQGRPLPAPPRPPRAKKEQIDRVIRTMEDFPIEVTAATQTDPLPDDMIIEEEVTQVKLVVSPSRSGSQVLVSTERIPSPSRVTTPPVPPLPVSQFLQRDEEDVMRESYDGLSLKSTSPIRGMSEERQFRREEAIHSEGINPRSVRSALLSDETLRIGSLEVGDLKVDRLSVSQIEAQRLIASEVDAMVITASEIRSEMGSGIEESLSPSIIKELIAIRSHLETAAATQAQIMHSTKSSKEDKSQKKIDIPSKDGKSVETSEVTPDQISSSVAEQQGDTKEQKSAEEDQKVVKTEVIDGKDKEISITQTLTIPESQEDQKIPVHTLTVIQTEVEGTEFSDTHSPLISPGMVEKSLQISDSDTPALSTETAEDENPERSVEEASTGFSIPEMTSSEFEESDDPRESMVSSDTTIKEDVESKEKKTRRSRSRSPSPITCPTRQTASPVRSLPPVISVTPDTPDATPGYNNSSDVQPQRAVISYSTDVEYSQKESHDSQRESSMSPTLSFPMGGTHFIAFPVSQIPSELLSTSEASSVSQHDASSDPGIIDTTQQLLRALHIAGKKAMRYFVSHLTTAVGRDDSREKIREVELAICALLLLIAGLLIVYFSSSRTIMHYHHWDYFNPPQ